MLKKLRQDVCCDDFFNAMQVGTDNEGYGCLINYYDNKFEIGTVGNFKFCPFCGKELRAS